MRTACRASRPLRSAIRRRPADGGVCTRPGAVAAVEHVPLRRHGRERERHRRDPGPRCGKGPLRRIRGLGAHSIRGTSARGAGRRRRVATVIEAARRIARNEAAAAAHVASGAVRERGIRPLGGRRYALDHEPKSAATSAPSRRISALAAFPFRDQGAAADLPGVVRIADLLAPLGVPFMRQRQPGGADIGPLRELGVPVFELQHDASKYFEIHHTDADRLDRIDPRRPGVQRGGLRYGRVGARAAALAIRAARPDLAARDSGVHACEWRP